MKRRQPTPEPQDVLVGQKVWLHLNAHPLHPESKPIKCTIEYIGKNWVGVRFTRRGTLYVRHIPRESILLVDTQTRVKPVAPVVKPKPVAPKQPLAQKKEK